MDPILALHIFAVIFWAGILAVETVIELQSGKLGAEAEYTLARYHFLIDTRLEIPTFMTVLITGFILFDPAQFQGIYAVKVVCGVLGVLANMYCVLPVMQRKAAAERGDYAAVEHQSRLIFRTIVGFTFILIALGIGLYWLISGR